jgi:glutathione S-transferase
MKSVKIEFILTDLITIKMKLFYTDNSPYARKVRVVAAHKQIELALEKVVLADPASPHGHYNPLGKVPVLVLANGESLYDSSVIVEYLDATTPIGRLIPEDRLLKTKVKRWEALADGICDAAVAVMLEQRRALEKQDMAIIAKQQGKVIRGLNAIEQAIGKAIWCVDGHYSLADIAIACMFGYVSVRMVDQIHFEKDYPNLMRLHKTMLEKPIFADTQLVAKY